jgi:lipid-A-disaccharide synthase
VAYRASFVTEWLGQKLIKIPHVSLPNILVNDAVVPELIAARVTPEALGRELLQLLRHVVLRELQVERFAAVRRELRRDAGSLAAAAIGSLLGR